ncbi:unnamed protein product [Acanthosepion pharaonis]|uniref:Transmembrane protein n=1 Tax=Acanthosepion pharaonis TaxID=158019 RepID=A0A812E3K1_ACAPH|nr:unnamed protein product [Sepia pharaonis]
MQYENEAAHSLEDAIRACDLISPSGSVVTSDRRRKEKRGFVVKMSTVFIAIDNALSLLYCSLSFLLSQSFFLVVVLFASLFPTLSVPLCYSLSFSLFLFIFLSVLSVSFSLCYYLLFSLFLFLFLSVLLSLSFSSSRYFSLLFSLFFFSSLLFSHSLILSVLLSLSLSFSLPVSLSLSLSLSVFACVCRVLSTWEIKVL